MKIINAILILIVNVSIAYSQYLGVGTQLVNHAPEEMYVKVDLCSNVEWTATSSEEWLRVGTQKYWSDSTGAWVTYFYSGTVIDLGPFEYLDIMVAGQDSAFLYLIADENTGEHRTAVVSVTGEGVPGYSQIVVNQSGTNGGVDDPGSRSGRVVKTGRKLYIDRQTGKIIITDERPEDD